jgi:hypothetical protein
VADAAPRVTRVGLGRTADRGAARADHVGRAEHGGISGRVLAILIQQKPSRTEQRASSAGDAVSRFIQPLANIFDGFAKRAAVHRDLGATPAASELPVIANPVDGLLGCIRALRAGDFYVRIVN